MERPFPLGFPFATGFYLTFYVLTLALHVFFMNYVLAGTGYLAVVSPIGGGNRSTGLESPKARVLRDWLPFALALTITAGVAPLLFIQILYQKSFYTANLLGFHRWMSILPVLIVGYYLLYLLKSRNLEHWPAAARALAAFGAFACFAWTGYSWTENHVLGRHEGIWPQFYGSGAMVFRNPEIGLRLAVWWTGAIPTMTIILAWQLRWATRREQFVPSGETRRTAVLALVGMGLSVICGAVYFLACGAERREGIIGPAARPYLALAVAGLLIQAAAWMSQRRLSVFCAKRLAPATLGVVLTVVGVTVVRECIRLQTTDNLTTLYALHREAFEAGGFTVFLIFFVIVAALITWCILLVKRGVA